MGDKKHIDRLFQERFKDFEVQPDDAVWKNIEAQLAEKKKKRRVIPIWWRYAGVAALLLLAFTVGSYMLKSDTSGNVTPQVVDTEQQNIENITKDNLQKKTKDGILNNNASSVSSNINNVDVEDVQSSDNSAKEIIKNAPNTKIQKTTVAHSKNNTVKTSSTVSKNKSKASYVNDASKVIANNSTIKNNTKANNNSFLKNNRVNEITDQVHNQVKPHQKTAVISSKSNNQNSNTSSKTNVSQNSKNTIVADNNSKKEEQSIEDAIEENKELLEEEKTEVAALNKWSISPNAAPVYFSSLGKGSSIGAQFNENSKSGEVNMSYGINASYALNKRLTVRSGINRVNLGYNTNNVVVFNSVSAAVSTSTLRTLSSSVVSDNTPVTSTLSADENISLISAETFKSNSISDFDTKTSINQSFGFIEVPLELQYALSTKRLGVNVIGGFSSLFLSNYNESVSQTENTPSARLQDSNNVNNTSYSANFGVGLNYKVSKNINLNLEPTFKYQINTFKNTSGNFQPFFVGVYTGFGIKF